MSDWWLGTGRVCMVIPRGLLALCLLVAGGLIAPVVLLAGGLVVFEAYAEWVLLMAGDTLFGIHEGEHSK